MRGVVDEFPAPEALGVRIGRAALAAVIAGAIVAIGTGLLLSPVFIFSHKIPTGAASGCVAIALGLGAFFGIATFLVRLSEALVERMSWPLGRALAAGGLASLAGVAAVALTVVPAIYAFGVAEYRAVGGGFKNLGQVANGSVSEHDLREMACVLSYVALTIPFVVLGRQVGGRGCGGGCMSLLGYVALGWVHLELVCPLVVPWLDDGAAPFAQALKGFFVFACFLAAGGGPALRGVEAIEDRLRRWFREDEHPAA